MTGVRIIGKRTARASPAGTPALETLQPTQSGPIARALASHWGILIIFPTLVLSVGLFLTWMAQDALRGSNLELAQLRMADQAKLVSEHLGAALGQADSILEDLTSFAATVDERSEPTQVALPLRRLLHGRPGTSYISISFPDGTFEGAFVDADGQVRFQVSRLQTDSTEERVYDFGERETLVLKEVRQSQYDPRRRPFYQLALDNTGPVWTEPYTFARTGDTGITRAFALRGVGPREQDSHEQDSHGQAGSREHAVLTVDFDVRRLSPLLARPEKRPERALLFDKDGTILADPTAQLDRPRSADGQFHLLNFRALDDAVLTALFTEMPQHKGADFFTFVAPSGPHLAATADLVGTSRLDWSVAFVAPEASFLSSLRDYSRQSYVLGGLAVLLATFISTAFARLVVRVRREASEAREAARRARKEAKELGSYRLVQKLGAGGMGEVWRAEHRLLARDAAIKLIITEAGTAASTVAQERFRREAQSLASLRSRNTIELFDYGVTEDGTFFYVMELLDGVDLESLVLDDGPQPAARVVKLLMQACRSLAEAHEAGLVHRDVKPANIFVCRIADELDIVKVLDFGLVRSVAQDDVSEADATEVQKPAPDRDAESAGHHATADAAAQAEPTDAPNKSAARRLTRADHVMGTPDFMAPEQAMGGQVDGRADIYALGGVAYWLLAARTLFRGTSVVEQLTSQLYDRPDSLFEVCPVTPPASLAKLIHQCLEKSPEARPQTALELYAALSVIDQEIGAEWQEAEVKAWWQKERHGWSALASSATVADEVPTAHTLAVEKAASISKAVPSGS